MVLLDAVLLLILMTSRFGVRKRRRRCVAMTMPRRPVAGLLVITIATLACTTTANAATLIYDAPTFARVDAHEFGLVDVRMALFGQLSGEAAPPDVARGTSTLPIGARNATEAACSFSGDTSVLMANGTRKPISEVEEGDYVYATDPESGEAGAREVIAALPHTDQLLTLRTSSGEVVTTEDHKYWNATDSEWQESQDLDEGDRLFTADGDEVTVEGLDWSTVHTAGAYDLTIDEFHTFYVGAGEESVLVHNCSLGDDIVKHIGDRSLNGVDDAGRAAYIEDLIPDNPLAQHRVLDEATGRQAWWDPIKENVVIDDGVGGGTAFHRPGGEDWFWEFLE
jgi:hypothetical protein